MESRQEQLGQGATHHGDGDGAGLNRENRRSKVKEENENSRKRRKTRYRQRDAESPDTEADRDNTMVPEAPKLSSSISEAEIEAKLLPTPRFRLFPWVEDVWTVEDEDRLHTAYGQWAHDVANQNSQSAAERPIWRIMLHLYGCHPYELFRYGLRPDTSACADVTADGRPSKVMGLSARMCPELQLVLVHPAFKTNLSLVRYALQLAVFYRVQDHVPPVGPATSNVHQLDKFWTALDLGSQEARKLYQEYSYLEYGKSGPAADPDIQELGLALKEGCDARAAESPQERQLFMLKAADIKAVAAVLDNITWYGKNKWRPADEYLRAYKITREGGLSTQLFPPRHLDMLVRWKKRCFLGMKRERLIREKMREMGMADDFLDIPQTDYLPTHILSEAITDEQRSVVRGIIYPPDEEPLPPANQATES